MKKENEIQKFYTKLYEIEDMIEELKHKLKIKENEIHERRK